MSATFTLHPKKHYTATVTLKGIEQLASNSQVQQKFADHGFTMVKSVGAGSTREVTGQWQHPQITVVMDEHFSNIKETA